MGMTIYRDKMIFCFLKKKIHFQLDRSESQSNRVSIEIVFVHSRQFGDRHCRIGYSCFSVLYLKKHPNTSCL